MTKTQLWNEVEILLSQHKVSKEFKSKLEDLIKPKSGGGVVQFPSIEKDGKLYHYCRYSSLYVEESQMVMSKGKSKGYSKKAIAKWTKYGKDIKALEHEAMKLLLDKKFEEGTNKSNEADKLKEDRNKTSMYKDIKDELLKSKVAFEDK